MEIELSHNHPGREILSYRYKRGNRGPVRASAFPRAPWLTNGRALNGIGVASPELGRSEASRETVPSWFNFSKAWPRSCHGSTKIAINTCTVCRTKGSPLVCNQGPLSPVSVTLTLSTAHALHVWLLLRVSCNELTFQFHWAHVLFFP